jgi:hypothetical protein
MRAKENPCPVTGKPMKECPDCAKEQRRHEDFLAVASLNPELMLIG